MNKFNKLTNKELKELTSLYDMLQKGMHYQNHPNHDHFMKLHNDLPDYKE
mgnify:FL=1|jgi:hypothetical protein|tara:strand:- start:2195 stop:2344 length:150 start_codon:yes stop_codon:yes gene_type:complete